MQVIQVNNLRKKYKDFEAVKGISFEVEKGEIFGILGPNGAGKTTTLEIIEGLKKQTSGNILVLGLDNLKENSELKRKIGVQLQASEYLHNLTLEELLTLFAALYGHKINAKEILSKVGLEAKTKNEVKELSGGQKQRFTIASALVHKPEILFLDEPTTGLDPKARRNMWQLVKELNSQGITIVLTTHYMEEAEYLCSRVAIMDSGRILKIGSPQKLIEDLSKIYKLSFFTDAIITKDFFKGFKVRNVYVEHPKVIAELEGMADVTKIIEKLKKEQVAYKFFNLKTATLEDVYLELTGHEYEE